VTVNPRELAVRRIRTRKDLAEGVAALVRACPRLAGVQAAIGEPPLRRRPAGFKGLARIVVAQQLSTFSANAIWRRLEARIAPFTPEELLTAPDADLRATGLSRAKIATLTGLARALADGAIDLEALTHAPEALIHEALTSLKGIGPWTADIYILFCLARADAWSPGDLALQLAVKDAFGLAERPDQALMVELAESWRPWRGVAARMLWSYYALRRGANALPA
jgi:DNA-3-methyladenine glycosylase II